VHAALLFAQVTEAPPLSLELRIPFSILHFLEFAIWGAWFVVLGNYLNSLHFSRKDIGRIYATMALGSVIAPMFMGTIADRYIPSEILMGVSHLVGAVLLFAMAQITTPRAFYWTALAYALVYSPTLILVNSIVFRHIPDAARDFPTIRVMGTIGWIAAGLSLRLMVRRGEPVNNRPLILAAVLSVLLGVYSLLTLVIPGQFTLPETPPLATATSEIPFLRAVTLLQEPSFAVFYGVSFFITLALAFYYSWTALFLEKHVGVKSENVGPLMTIGQWVEIFFMFTLPWFLDVLGMKGVLALGMAAWGVRYALFGAGGPLPLIILGIALHGICFDFFFAAGFIYVEKTAPPDIQASGQALFGVLTYGLGMWLGTEFSGWLNQWLTVEVPDPKTSTTVRVTDWRKFWLVPCVGVLISLVVFVLLF
jgi:nucleoside transporter